MRDRDNLKGRTPAFVKLILSGVGTVVFASILALSYNSFSGRGISLKGNWSNKTLSDSLIVPYSYQEGDPQAISISEAMMEFQAPHTIFLDARSDFDYKQGHIKGALNLPFEEFDDYYPEIASRLPKDKTIIAYCDGTECELSLFLTRILRGKGYQDLKIFFGGWAEWLDAGLHIEKGVDP